MIIGINGKFWELSGISISHRRDSQSHLKLFAIMIEEVYISMINLLKMNYNG